MKPQTMTREDFIEAHRAECRAFFAILKEIDATWEGRRCEESPRRDAPAARAASVQRKRTGPTLADRMRDGDLVVLGFDK